MPNSPTRMARTFNTARAVESINFKIAVILCIIIIGLASNGVRSFLDVTGDKRQARIEYLDKRVIELEAQLESCNSGTPQPAMKD